MAAIVVATSLPGTGIFYNHVGRTAPPGSARTFVSSSSVAGPSLVHPIARDRAPQPRAVDFSEVDSRIDRLAEQFDTFESRVGALIDQIRANGKEVDEWLSKFQKS